jgi:hypothetical protein
LQWFPWRLSEDGSSVRHSKAGASHITMWMQQTLIQHEGQVEMTVIRHQKTYSAHQPINEISVLWITAGLGCDGESVALTAATQPSIEDLVLGG